MKKKSKRKSKKKKNPSSVSKDIIDIGLYFALIAAAIYGVFYLGK